MKGTIKRINDVQQVSDKFKKQELHLSFMDGEYEQTICIEFHQDDCSKLDSFSAGQKVDLEYNLRGREWRKDDNSPIRVFNTLVGWKIGAVQNGFDPDAELKKSRVEPSAEKMGDDSDGDDDLPF